MEQEKVQGVGDLLRTLRHSRRMSQEDAAAKAGLARLTLIRWERGTHQPRLPELAAILDILEVSPAVREQALASVSAPRAAYYRRERQGSQAAENENRVPVPGIGDLLRAMRLRRRQTQEQIAAQMGIRRNTISQWEGGELLPSLERLDHLLTLLGAHPDEREALTRARLLPSLAANGTYASLDAMVERLQYIANGAYNADLEPLKDLEYLRLEAGLAQIVSRHPAAHQFLLETYTWHAQWLGSNQRYGEAEGYTNQVMDRESNKILSHKRWLHTVLVAAQAAVHRGKHSRPERGMEILRQWLPFSASHPEYEAWMYGDLAFYLKQAGQTETALKFAARACRVARRCENATELRCRRVDYAALLLQTGSPHDAMRALDMLPADLADHPGERMREAVLWSEGLLWVGETAEAHDWLGRAYALVQEHHLDATLVDALAQRF